MSTADQAGQAVGEAIGTTARRLHDGSAALTHVGGWLWAGGWLQLPIRATALIGGSLYVLAVIAPATPGAMPLITTAWCIAAWRRARRAERQAAAEEAFLQLLDNAIGPRNGVLLADILLLLHRDEFCTEWDVTDVRAQCEALGVTVRDSLKVDGRVSIGIHRDDLDAARTPPPPLSSTPPPEGSSQVSGPTTSERSPTEVGEEEPTVEHPYEGMTIIRYPAESASRHHRVA